MRTTIVVATTSLREGNVTFLISERVSVRKVVRFFQPLAMDATVLPTSDYLVRIRPPAGTRSSVRNYYETLLYSRISVTAPAPTVRPPSRMAKRTPFSIAIGAISSTSKFTLSPGITISVPLGS